RVVLLAAHHHALYDGLTAIEERLVLGFRGSLRGGCLRQAHLCPGLDFRSPLAEPLHLSARVDDALRAREERVAHGADLGLELLARRSGREGIPARAGDDRVFVESGMNLC